MSESPHPSIVLADLVADYPAAAWEALASSGVSFAGVEGTGEEAEALIRDAEVLLVAKKPVPAAAIEQLRRCKAIIRVGVGYDIVDVDAARERGIAVCNVPDFCTREVADHAMALALALARALPFLDRCVRARDWKPALPHPMPAFETMTFGVLGFGRIGRLTMARARGFGFRMMAHDPYVPEHDFPDDIASTTLDRLLAEADILSLHVPLTRETRQILNTDALARMKPTAILVNTARGPVVETDALVDALAAGRLAAAGLDVFEEEPLPLDHPLLALPNVLATPHFAWHSRESRPKRYLMAVEEALRAARGEPLQSCVNLTLPA